MEYTSSGILRYSRGFLPTFTRCHLTKPVSDDTREYIESHVVPMKKRVRREGSTEMIKKKQKPSTVGYHSTVKCQINQPEQQQH